MLKPTQDKAPRATDHGSKSLVDINKERKLAPIFQGRPASLSVHVQDPVVPVSVEPTGGASGIRTHVSK